MKILVIFSCLIIITCGHEYFIKVDPHNIDLIKLQAKNFGLKYVRKVVSNVYLFEDVVAESDNKRKKIQKFKDRFPGEVIAAGLKHRSFVKYNTYQHCYPTTPEHLFIREKRPLQSRPLYEMDIQQAWSMNYTGKGVSVAVVDNGVDMNHTDLIKNLNMDLSLGFDSESISANPKRFWSYRETDKNTSHGTMAAGLIGAEFGNECCSAGVAFNATLIALRALVPHLHYSLNRLIIKYSVENIHEALEYERDKIDVYSNSYTFGNKYKENLAISTVLEDGIRSGRNGCGNIFVFSAGNRGTNVNDCNMDLFATSIYTITITSIGKNGAIPDFAIPCACSLASTYGIYTTLKGDSKLETTTHDDECADFDGTSASAALASGIIALTLQANPSLTWRDMQHLIVLTSSHERLVKNETIKNAKGLFYSPYFGFGLMNATKMVKKAENWKTVPQQINTYLSNPQIKYVPKNTIDIYWNMPDSRIKSLEHVSVRLKYRTRYEDSINMILCSPSGTCCNILHNDTRKKNTKPFTISWTYMTVSFWGESSQGEWKLSVIVETGRMEFQSTTSLEKAMLIMYGTGDDLNNRDSGCVNEGSEGPIGERAKTEPSVVKSNSSSLSTIVPIVIFCVILFYACNPFVRINRWLSNFFRFE